MQGKLSRVDLIQKESYQEIFSGNEFLQGLSQNTKIQSVNESLEAGERLTRAFRVNLTALSLLTLVVGMFLIYNTMTFSVVQRFGLLGRMRVIGMTRKEVFNWILLEALIIGSLGTVMGLFLGMILAESLLNQVTQTMNDLYFVQTVSSVQFSPITLSKSILLGIGARLYSAYLPASQGLGQIVGPNLAASILSLNLGYESVFMMCWAAAMLAMVIYWLLHRYLRATQPELADAS